MQRRSKKSLPCESQKSASLIDWIRGKLQNTFLPESPPGGEGKWVDKMMHCKLQAECEVHLGGAIIAGRLVLYLSNGYSPLQPKTIRRRPVHWVGSPLWLRYFFCWLSSSAKLLVEAKFSHFYLPLGNLVVYCEFFTRGICLTSRGV